MECLRHQKPPSYPPVVVVDSTVGVVPSMSPGLLSLAATTECRYDDHCPDRHM